MDIMEPMKCCRDCGQDKPLSEFYASPGRRDGRASYCKPCHNARNRAWAQANPEKVRESVAAAGRRYRGKPARATRGPVHGPPVPTGQGRWVTRGQLHGPPAPKQDGKLSRFGLSQEDYRRILDAQGGVCALCGGTDPDRRLAVDHCHETGRLRGLLCFACNTGLGKLGDTVAALERAIEYLRGAA